MVSDLPGLYCRLSLSNVFNSIKEKIGQEKK